MYYTKAITLLESLKEALRSLIAWAVFRIHIYLDSLSVMRNKKQITKRSSQGIFKQFRTAAGNLLEIEKQMMMQLISKNIVIGKNKIVDEEAKKQAKLSLSHQVKIVQTLSNAKNQSKIDKDKAWQLKKQIDSSLRALQIDKDLRLIPTTRRKSLPQWALKQKVLRWLFATRAKYSNFVSYNERLKNKKKLNIYCRCRKRQAKLYSFTWPFEKNIEYFYITKKHTTSTNQKGLDICEWVTDLAEKIPV